jgi:MinD-like ATPase involved in chromosome partitioning or flagellar assembly
MTTIAIAATKGSPGATTLALALADRISQRGPALLVEADAAGGDIAARCGLSLDPGLLTLAASGRRGLDRSSIDRHTQLLPCGALLLAGPTSAEQATSALTGVAAALAQTLTLAHETSTVIIDAGRWDPRSPATDLVASASVGLLALRPTMEGVEHARWQLHSLSEHVRRVVAVCVGERPYPRAEVASALAVDELYLIASDARAANAIGLGVAGDRWLRRSPLMRSATVLADQLLGAPNEATVLQ